MAGGSEPAAVPAGVGADGRGAELKATDPGLAKKMLAVELGRQGDLDLMDARRGPVHEKFIPWHKQVRGKKLTPQERERMDQLGKKAVPKARKPR